MHSGAMQRFTPGYRAWLLLVLLLANALNLADRLGMAVVSQAIKTDLQFTDRQMGLIQGLGFAILYTLLGFPIARLAEHTHRTRIIAGSLAIFGAMAWACSTAHSFGRLLLFRIGVGIGDAGFGPPVASLVGDHFPMQKRASAMSIIWLGAPLGVVAGATLGGWMAEHISWRGTFIAIGIPGLMLAAVAFLTLKEPVRGMSDAGGIARGAPPPFRTVLGFLLSKRSMCHVLIGCGAAAIAMNAIGQFLASFLVRAHHLGFAQAGRYQSLIGATAMASGLALGGFGVDWAGKFDKRWYAWGPAIGLVLAAPAFLIAFSQTSVAGAVAWLMVGHVTLFIYFTPTMATAQNMVRANMRASSAFTVALVLGLIGIGIGPTLLGFLSDAFAQNAFAGGDYRSVCARGAQSADSALQQACGAASAAGIRSAMMVMSVFLVWAAVHYLLAARTLRADLLKEHTDDVGPVTAPAAR